MSLCGTDTVFWVLPFVDLFCSPVFVEGIGFIIWSSSHEQHLDDFNPILLLLLLLLLLSEYTIIIVQFPRRPHDIPHLSNSRGWEELTVLAELTLKHDTMNHWNVAGDRRDKMFVTKLEISLNNTRFAVENKTYCK